MADFVWKECCTPTMRAAEAIEQRNGVIVNPITFKTKKKWETKKLLTNILSIGFSKATHLALP